MEEQVEHREMADRIVQTNRICSRIGRGLIVVSAMLLGSCGIADTLSFPVTTSATVAHAPSVQLASVRARDAETAAQIASNGALLYNADTN